MEKTWALETGRLRFQFVVYIFIQCYLRKATWRLRASSPTTVKWDNKIRFAEKIVVKVWYTGGFQFITPISQKKGVPSKEYNLLGEQDFKCQLRFVCLFLFFTASGGKGLPWWAKNKPVCQITEHHFQSLECLFLGLTSLCMFYSLVHLAQYRRT